jgi:hypothetical protein
METLAEKLTWLEQYLLKISEQKWWPHYSEIQSSKRTKIMRLISSKLAFFGIGVTLAGSPGLAQTQWAGNGHYYQVVGAQGIDWSRADTAANALIFNNWPGHLVTITSAGEDGFVNGLIASGGFGEVWSGGFQTPTTETDPEAGWTWVNGEGPFPGNNSGTIYAAWSPLAGSQLHPLGQPDDYFGPASEQAMGLNLWGPASGWNDEGNVGLITGYVVEYQSPNGVPDGGSTLRLMGGALAGLVAVARRRLNQ